MLTRKRSLKELENNSPITRLFDEPKNKRIRLTKRGKNTDKDEEGETSDEEGHEEDKFKKMMEKINSEDLLSLFKKKDKVYRRENHIYFNTDVSNTSINKLGELISEVEEEFETVKNDLLTTNKNLVNIENITPKPIYLHITSYGGSLFAGFRGIDIIRNSKIPIHTIVEGYAMSAASQMAVAGHKRYMTKNSYVLIHQLRSYNESGTFEELKDHFTNNKSLMKKIIDIYYEYTNKKITKKNIEVALRRDLYWSYDYCLEHGFVDGLYQGDKN
jgi:ATP-dependent protease ClpP protease subunit